MFFYGVVGLVFKFFFCNVYGSSCCLIVIKLDCFDFGCFVYWGIEWENVFVFMLIRILFEWFGIVEWSFVG